jgi:hypothetical protein
MAWSCGTPLTVRAGSLVARKLVGLDSAQLPNVFVFNVFVMHVPWVGGVCTHLRDALSVGQTHLALVEERLHGLGHALRHFAAP